MRRILLIVALMLVASTTFASGCIVELQTDRGRVLDTFKERGYDIREACGVARRECNRELDYLHSMGRNPHAECLVVRKIVDGGNNPHPSPPIYGPGMGGGGRPAPIPKPIRIEIKQKSIECSSIDLQFNRCYVSRLASKVRLSRQITNAVCTKGITWGFSGSNIWVANGCRGIFTYEINPLFF